MDNRAFFVLAPDNFTAQQQNNGKREIQFITMVQHEANFARTTNFRPQLVRKTHTCFGIHIQKSRLDSAMAAMLLSYLGDRIEAFDTAERLTVAPASPGKPRVSAQHIHVLYRSL